MGIGKDKNLLTETAELRRRAEEKLKAKTAKAPFPQAEAESQRLLHELEVHQVELEIQNAELREAREELEMSLEKYTGLYDFAPVGYFTLDRQGTILRVNLTGASLLGIVRSRLIGQSFGTFVAAEARPFFSEFLGKVFASPDKESYEVVLSNAGNSPLFAQIEAVAAVSGEECLMALSDITERKQAEEALRKEKEAAEVLRLAKETVEATARAKSQFLANMSHELRTPMTGVLGMLDIVLSGSLEAEQRESIETAQTAARSLVRILNDILDITKIEADRLSIEEKPFSLRKCLENMINILLPVAKSKGLDLNLTVADNVPETLVGDQIRINQVLTNLAGNAVKFTEKGKVKIHVTASDRLPDGRHAVTFSVTDTGIGIPADKQEYIFQPFTQADESHTRIYGGSGLGLAIAKAIVERMGGTIGFTSEEGKGSTFSCTIPLYVAESGHHSALTTRETTMPGDVPCAEAAARKRLLVAEDDPITRQVLGTMLQMAKYDTDFAEIGQKVVEMWENGKYDLILMDVQMPLLNGFEATIAIREKERARSGHIPIVAMTAHALKEDEERCLNSGMDAYISKPIDLKECLQLIGETFKKAG
jgi:PAS domain S-box-containing protein